MENASKALLIAGAILLVIALIAVGMGIFGTARGTINKAEGQIDNMKVQLHNQQFLQYEGIGKSLSTKNEIDSLIANNNNTSDERYKVGIKMCSYSKSDYNGIASINNNPSDGGFYYYHYPDTYVYDITFNRFIYFLTPGKDFYNGGTQYGTGSEYDVRFLYDENGIINIIYIFRYHE